MRGAWIEILKRIIVRSEDNGRSPCGERGLKYFPIFEVAMCPRRSPCGERGLKSAYQVRKYQSRRSLPVRGAWIEIETTP